MIVNLVDNALKFTSAGDVSVEVSTDWRDDGAFSLYFTVRDTGIGIPPEKQRIIFQPFSQADGSITRQYGGTGLGLTISSRLVEMSGGKIWVDSVPGQGSAFHFTTILGVSHSAKSSPALAMTG